jgi:hypothetical protein
MRAKDLADRLSADPDSEVFLAVPGVGLMKVVGVRPRTVEKVADFVLDLCPADHPFAAPAHLLETP